MTTRALFIGRFQPFHKGHLHTLRRTVEKFGEVIIGIGSSQYSHTLENPYTASERHQMISRALEAEGLQGCQIIHIPDIGVHSQWVSHVLSLVPPFNAVVSHDPLTRRLFREAGIKVVDGPLLKRDVLSGTEIRRRMLGGEEWKDLVPTSVADFLLEIDGVGRTIAIASIERQQAE